MLVSLRDFPIDKANCSMDVAKLITCELFGSTLNVGDGENLFKILSLVVIGSALTHAVSNS